MSHIFKFKINIRFNKVNFISPLISFHILIFNYVYFFGLSLLENFSHMNKSYEKDFIFSSRILQLCDEFLYFHYKNLLVYIITSR